MAQKTIVMSPVTIDKPMVLISANPTATKRLPYQHPCQE